MEGIGHEGAGCRDTPPDVMPTLRLAGGRGCCKIKKSSGSNSVVECDLAKVEVAGSNPVSRSRILLPSCSCSAIFSERW